MEKDKKNFFETLKTKNENDRSKKKNMRKRARKERKETKRMTKTFVVTRGEVNSNCGSSMHQIQNKPKTLSYVSSSSSSGTMSACCPSGLFSARNVCGKKGISELEN